MEIECGGKDGIPTALLEAMASGLLVVATDAGSMREVITDGHDGILVPQRDAQALAVTIASCLRDPARRVQLGQHAVQTIRTRFDVTVCERLFHERLLQLRRGHPHRGW